MVRGSYDNGSRLNIRQRTTHTKYKSRNHVYK